ncbi:hypothetical protein P872_18465 [Rhodonellum psychrophilum GCM71 = DSM 17998]|uniref:Phage capsid-like C-terminal domain-containing protein n=2 Tax=Rhodonellum TaxID=336827 RepID=U5BPA1_9BACT|nr:MULTISPECIES: phage major capsid protein [Rhodonellum]ERM82380.1 hypothetical protein P872_18465 [Rhodonellum psychrophilum GCM71 = DSM 17998]SDZ35557.1 phage major capsid protein, HK97 family [Rhodonellum ikkaensis]
MKKSLELKRKLAVIETEMRTILDAGKVENRDLNADEQLSFNTKFEEVEAMKRSIVDAEKVESFEARQAGISAPVIGNRSSEKYSILGHIQAVRSGKLDGIYGEAQAQGELELKNSGVNVNPSAVYIPTNYERDFSVTGDAGAKGGNLVSTDKGPIIESLFEGSLLDKLGVQKMLGLTSNLDLPKGGAVVSTWRTENQAVVKSDHSIGQIELRPNRLATRMSVSNQLMTQSSSSVDAYLRKEIMKSIQKSLDEKYLENLFAASDAKQIVMGTNGAALTYAKLQEFIEAVGKSEADVEASMFLINYDLYSALKALPKVAGSDRFVLENGLIDGFKYIASNRVKADFVKGTGTGLSGMVFGDHTTAICAGWGGIEIIVDNFSEAANGALVLNVGSYWDLKDKYFEGKSLAKDIIA